MKSSKCKVCSGSIIYNPRVQRGVYCSNKCQGYEKTQISNARNQELLQKGQLSNRNIIKKTLISMGVEHMCSVCGIKDWQSKPLSMILDHINGKANDNSIGNLRLLCHNCDSQSDHYKGRNKGNGRKSLGLL